MHRPIHIHERMSRPKVTWRGSESSWNFRPRERKFHTMVLSLPAAKVLRSESSIILFFDTAPVLQYVVNEGIDNKLNSMDSVLVDIEENVVII